MPIPVRRLAPAALLPLFLIPILGASPPAPDFLGESGPRASILFVGTFHFADAGLDAYKPRFPFDALSPARQKEIEEVVRLLAERYRPTKIAIEYPAHLQARLDSVYDAERRGLRKPSPNEVTQIGFRLAKQMGHARVYAVDARAREYDPDLTLAGYHERIAASLARDSVRVQEWARRYRALYAYDDSLKSVRPLRETLLYINGPDRLRQGLGHYLVGDVRYGGPGEYVGADVASAWWNRNLRIFGSLLRLPASPEDRILVLIGAGHVPILAFAAQSCPELRFVPLSDVLGGR
jgi:hypothetical protein